LEAVSAGGQDPQWTAEPVEMKKENNYKNCKWILRNMMMRIHFVSRDSTLFYNHTIHSSVSLSRSVGNSLSSVTFQPTANAIESKRIFCNLNVSNNDDTGCVLSDFYNKLLGINIPSVLQQRH
jgi:hypothetical protein